MQEQLSFQEPGPVIDIRVSARRRKTIGAHWEGETLVIDVTNLGDKTWLDSARHSHSDALHVVERYTRTGPDTILYEVRLDDSKTYTKPWNISMLLHRNTEPGFELREQECTEGDDGRAIHPFYRPAPNGDPLEFVRTYPKEVPK